MQRINGRYDDGAAVILRGYLGDLGTQRFQKFLVRGGAEEFFEVGLVDTHMADSHHHIFAVIVDTKVATSAELVF